MSPTTPQRTAVGDRIVSLDAFRGATVAAMILVNNPGSWAHVYAPLRHAAWHGWTPTDLIFPFFLFIVGVAMPFSFARRRMRGATRGDLFRHVVRRSAVLIVLGLAMRAVPDFDLAEMRYYGVLQRIGLVYLVAGTLFLLLELRALAVTAAVILLGYWAAMTLVPVPGYGAGDLSPDGNLAAYVDRLLLAGHLWQGTWDPEGLLSTLPAVATTLLGIFAGTWIRSSRAPQRISRGLAAAGVACTAAGLVWGTVFPINKNLWTSSYVVFTAGVALLALGALHRVVDVRGARGVWLTPWVAYGMNPIALFVASGMFTKFLLRARVGGGEGTSLYGWLYAHVFVPWAGPLNGSLAFALAHVALWWGVAHRMHSRGIYIKV